MLRRLNHLVRLKGFAKDSRGVSAIEFAFVAPILIMCYLALAELTLGMMASRRTSHLAATIGDLAAQSETLSQANINDLWNIGTSMLLPFSTKSSSGVAILKMRLTLVKMVNTSGTSQAKVQWSKSSNWTDYVQDQVIPSITTAQISDNEYLVMTEVEYDYDSPIGNFLPGTTKFTDTFYHHPRNGTAVTYTP